MPTSQLREQLVGAWRLVSYEIRPRDGGTVTYPLGRDARGWILYTPDGYMSAQLMAPGRPLMRTATCRAAASRNAPPRPTATSRIQALLTSTTTAR